MGMVGRAAEIGESFLGPLRGEVDDGYALEDHRARSTLGDMTAMEAT
jgi:hypothetical protein